MGGLGGLLRSYNCIRMSFSFKKVLGAEKNLIYYTHSTRCSLAVVTRKCSVQNHLWCVMWTLGQNGTVYKAWTIDLVASLDTSKPNKTLRKQCRANLNLCVTIYMVKHWTSMRTSCNLHSNTNCPRSWIQAVHLAVHQSEHWSATAPTFQKKVVRNGRKKIIQTHMWYDAMFRLQLNACFLSCFLSALFCEILIKGSGIVVNCNQIFENNWDVTWMEVLFYLRGQECQGDWVIDWWFTDLPFPFPSTAP